MEFTAGDGDARADLHHPMEPDGAFDARRAQLSQSTAARIVFSRGGLTGLLSASRSLHPSSSSLRLCAELSKLPFGSLFPFPASSDKLDSTQAA